jgi:chromosome partitioning protein
MSVHPNLDVMPGNRETRTTEDIIAGQMARERYLELAFKPAEEGYDAIIFDVSPSISWFQTCAMYYTRQVLIPIAMEPLSVQGATAAAQVVRSMNEMFNLNPPVRVIGLLPTIVNRRLQMTDTVLETLAAMADRQGAPLLPAIRTDTAVVKAARHKKFLADFDKSSKALEDYKHVTQILLGSRDQEQAATTVSHAQAQAS